MFNVVCLSFSAASLVAVATGLSTGTTLVTFAALAAVATALALRGFSLLRAATAALLSFGTTLVLSAALVLLLAGSSLLAAGARALFASAALRIGSTVASCIATAAVLASAGLLFSTIAVGLLAALGSILAASSRLASTESIYILLDTAEHHFADTLRGQRGTGDAIHFSFGLALAFLDDGEGDLAILAQYGATNELALEGLVLDEGTQTSGLTLVVEESAEHLLAVGRDSHIAPDAAPEATALEGKNEGVLSVGGLCRIDGELLADLLGIDVEGVSALDDLTVGSQHTCFFDQLVVLRLYIALGNAANVERSQDLCTFVDGHVGILSRLQRAAHVGQQEGNDYDHDCCIADGVHISIGVNAL